MCLVSLAWKMYHFWNTQVVSHPLPCPYLKTFTFIETILPLQIFTWRFRTSRTVLKYSRSGLYGNLYISRSLTMIFDDTFFRSLSLDIIPHLFFIFVIIVINDGNKFNNPIGITFHPWFPFGVKNSSLHQIILIWFNQKSLSTAFDMRIE